MRSPERDTDESEGREMQGSSKRQGVTQNGGRRGAAFATIGDVPYDDPMSKVLGLDAKTSSLGAWFGFTSGSTLLLVGFMALASVMAWIHTMRDRQAASVPDEIEVMKEDPPPPPPPPPPEEEKKEEPVVVPHARDVPAPPPAPAQAAKVLTQEPTPDEPIDLTGNTIVQGNADSYAGGFTSASGTDPNAVRKLTGPTGVVGGKAAPKAAASAKPDLSRQPSFGDRQWNCDFPEEADQINDESVIIVADIKADGTPSAVHVLKDPGNGFAAAAVKCAMRRRAAPGLDMDGSPVPASTGKIIVHFTR